MPIRLFYVQHLNSDLIYNINMKEEGLFSFGLRKVIQLCRSKHVSLPMDWVKNYGIAKGDCVEVFLTSDGNLLIKPRRRVV